MTKKRKVWICLACLAGGFIIGALGTFWAFWPEKEPQYKGVSLSQWLEVHMPYNVRTQSKAESEAAEIAVQYIGTNAIPYFLKWIRYEPTHFRGNLAGHPDCPAFLSEWLLHPCNKSDHAVEGFKILGTNAASAIPELTRLMNKNKMFSSRQAIEALSHLGKDAAPPIIEALGQALDSTNRITISRFRLFGAIRTMRDLGTNMTPAVPILVRYTQGQDEMIISAALKCLGALKLEPEISIPAITNCLTNQVTPLIPIQHALAEFGVEMPTNQPITNATKVNLQPDPQ